MNVNVQATKRMCARGPGNACESSPQNQTRLFGERLDLHRVKPPKRQAKKVYLSAPDFYAMMSPFLLVAVLFVPRCVATPDLPVQAAADSQATQTDGTLDVRLDVLNARVKALTKLTQKKAVSAMKKCDGSRDYKERKENRCNKDKDCGGANQDGPKCQTWDCNFCTDGKPGAKCWDSSECAAGYSCDQYAHGRAAWKRVCICDPALGNASCH